MAAADAPPDLSPVALRYVIKHLTTQHLQTAFTALWPSLSAQEQETVRAAAAAPPASAWVNAGAGLRSPGLSPPSPSNNVLRKVFDSLSHELLQSAVHTLWPSLSVRERANVHTAATRTDAVWRVLGELPALPPSPPPPPPPPRAAGRSAGSEIVR